MHLVNFYGLCDSQQKYEKYLTSRKDLIVSSKNVVFLIAGFLKRKSFLLQLNFENKILKKSKFVVYCEIKEKYEQLSVGEMVTFETLLRDKSIDATNIELAFAILFRKLDDNGKETEFNIDDFLFVLKNIKEKVLAIDVIQHVNFFLSGDK